MRAGQHLLVIHRPGSRSAPAAAERWRRAGAEVHCVAASSPRALVEAIDSRAWSGIALWSPEPGMQHALARSLRHAETPVAAFFDGFEGLHSEAHLERPFTEGPVEPLPATATELHALRLLASDPRARLVFRSCWHADAFAERIAPLERAFVIAPGSAAPAAFERVPHRVAFLGTVGLERRHGVDLFVRGMVELAARPGAPAFEIAVVADRVADERALGPLSHRPVRRCAEAEVLSSAAVVVIAARDGTGLEAALMTTRAGARPLVLAHPATLEWVPGVPTCADDPAALADALERELAREAPVRLDAPPDTTAQELALFEASSRPRALPTQPPRLTVAVPAYNAARYLERCVTSLVHGDPRALTEVLIIDDGSTDDTAARARELVERHGPRVRLVQQPNKGHGGAINTAIREAKGTWFRVVDADDFVDPLAFSTLLGGLDGERADLVLTGYAEDRLDAALPAPIELMRRLPPGGLARFETIVDPIYGLTSWGPLLSTSTFRTRGLRDAGVVLTEKSAYVDLEYCTFALATVETLRWQPLDLYRYSLGVEGQSVSAQSYAQKTGQHEAVIVRLCEFARDGRLSASKRRYVVERVIAPIVATHLEVLLEVRRDRAEASAFRKRMEAYGFVPLPADHRARTAAKNALKAALPGPLTDALVARRDRTVAGVAETVTRYILPSGLIRRRNQK